jgi:catechol 2,3-dioxygenase-like lactoylglutathione lyase family enzyme
MTNGNEMKRIWTIIGVRDVPGSFKWYQSLFGLPEQSPAHDDFGQILDTDGTVLLCLHEWGVQDHPPLMSPDKGTPGNGLLLFFRVDDYERPLKRARALVARFEEESHLNLSTQTMEFSLRDPDGYYVTISAVSAAKQRRPKRRRPNKRLQRPKARGRTRKLRERRRPRLQLKR